MAQRLNQWTKIAKNLTAVRMFLRQVSGGDPVWGTLNSADLNVNSDVAASVDGLLAGLIPAGAVWINVTSSNADYIITLPLATAATIGQRIRGYIGATGCEIRTPATTCAQLWTI